MSEWFVKSEAVVISNEEAVDLDQKPTVKKRMAVAGVLALAALGTHWLPGRAIVPMQNQTQRTAVAQMSGDKMLTGPNSLLGDAIADPTAQLLTANDVAAEVGVGHLDVDASVDQSGVSKLLSSLDRNTDGFAVPADGSGVTTATAVPEPATAGLLLLAAAPVLARRKNRATA
jgi:hypothetical protein